MRKPVLIVLLLLLLCRVTPAKACTILYYVDSGSGKIYAVNNEDYWYNVKAYIRIVPGKKHSLARLWYGWKNFAQGGINEAGLYFDGAATPQQRNMKGLVKGGGNLGDRILSKCRTVEEAIGFLTRHGITLSDGHVLLGDRTGNAVVVEWVNGERRIVHITDNRLLVTNFLLTDTAKGNYPCPRYTVMDREIKRLQQNNTAVALKDVRNVLAKTIQPVRKNKDGREWGTLYSSFINITDMKFVLVYKYNNAHTTEIDLAQAFASRTRQRIWLDEQHDR